MRWVANTDADRAAAAPTRRATMTHPIKTMCLLSTVLLLAACGASPTSVCDHMIELAKKEGNDAVSKKAEEGRGECISSLESAKEMQGAVEYSRSADCIMDATTLKAAIACQE